MITDLGKRINHIVQIYQESYYDGGGAEKTD